MTESGAEAFGELRSLLNASRPSRARFTRALRLCAARWAQAPTEVEEQWLPYAESHLEGWPDAHRALDVSELSFDPRRPEPWMGLARRLSLSRVGLGDQDVDAIGLRTVHARLRALDLSHNDLTMLGGRRLARMLSRATHLEALDVSSNTMGFKASRMILDTLGPTSVRSIDLSDVSRSSAGVRALLGADTSGFDALTLSGSFLGDDLCAELVGSGLFDPLERVALTRLGLSIQSMIALGERSFERLRALDLSGCSLYVGDHGIGLDAATFPALESFSIRGLSVSPEVAGMLASCEWFGRLSEFDASGVPGLGSQGVLSHIVEAGGTRCMRALDLSSWRPGASEFEALVRKSPRLERLRLEGCVLEYRSVAALCQGDSPLSELDLSFNPGLGERSMRAIALMSQERELRALTLRGGRLDLRAARALGGLRARSLDLSGCHLGDRGVIALCEGGALDSVESLKLRDNAIGLAGASALAASGASWDVLDVSENPLGQKGRALLASSTTLLDRGHRSQPR